MSFEHFSIVFLNLLENKIFIRLALMKILVLIGKMVWALL